ncbi:MAG: ribosomal RNA small subunit methyltransferase A, partial [Bdellovibrionales bacterium]|nr:ribosomal RNA small subunit methyltransferase A [Bdellovibrionales bacterium]
LSELGITAKKSRGQNFLYDRNAAEQIVSFADLRQGPVIEVGPGLGTLTELLAKRTANLTLIELEQTFADHLVQRGIIADPAQVIVGDARSINLEQHFPGQAISVISNVPYSISTDLVLWVLEQRRVVRRACFLLQREFAERLASGPGSKRYGSLSVWRALFATAELGPRIPGTVFHPPTKVESQVIRMDIQEHPRIPVEDLHMFRTVVRAAFSQRRKMLSNSLQGLFETKAQTAAALLNMAIDPNLRVEQVTLEQFARIASALKKNEQ